MLSADANHLRESLLINFGEDRTARLFSELDERRNHAGEALFTGIYQAAREISLDFRTAPEQEGNEIERSISWSTKHFDHWPAVNSQELHVRESHRTVKPSGAVQRNATLAEELSSTGDCNDGFPALARYHRKLHIPTVDVKNRVAGIALRKNHLFLSIPQDLFRGTNSDPKGADVKTVGWRARIALQL